jgi:diacylglycerol kinase family enzyme
MSPFEPGRAAQAVKLAIEEGDDAVVAVGGDGTVSAVASALVSSEMPLGVVPLGTRNHFAKDLKLPTEMEAAIQTIAARRTIKVDVGELNGRIFINNASLGVYPDIVVEREALRRRGLSKGMAFLSATAAILRTHRGLVVKITADESVQVARTPFLMIGNNEYKANGVHLAERSRLNGGRLSAYLAPRVHTRDLPKLLASALLGRGGSNHNFQSIVARELTAEIPERRPLKVAIDGEIVVMTAPLYFRVRPLALRVIAP